MTLQETREKREMRISERTPGQMPNLEAAREILSKHGNRPAELIPILQEIQHEYRYLPEEILYLTAYALGLPPARVFGVATFYSHFTLKPKGKYLIRVCDGTACHVKGSMRLERIIRTELNLADGTDTTPDLLFTLETVSCLGACGLAPVLTVNDEVHGQMDARKVTALVAGIRKEEAAKGDTGERTADQCPVPERMSR